MVPDTRYTKSGDVHIAYQVVGDGSRDLVYLPGIFAHIELQWEEPSYARFLRRLSSFSRLIALDMRGTGLSDRSAQLPLLEHQMDDVTSVLDAVGSDRAVLFGVSQSGPMGGPLCGLKPPTNAGSHSLRCVRFLGGEAWLSVGSIARLDREVSRSARFELGRGSLPRGCCPQSPERRCVPTVVGPVGALLLVAG